MGATSRFLLVLASIVTLAGCTTETRHENLMRIEVVGLPMDQAYELHARGKGGAGQSFIQIDRSIEAGTTGTTLHCPDGVYEVWLRIDDQQFFYRGGADPSDSSGPERINVEKGELAPEIRFEFGLIEVEFDFSDPTEKQNNGLSVTIYEAEKRTPVTQVSTRYDGPIVDGKVMVPSIIVVPGEYALTYRLPNSQVGESFWYESTKTNRSSVASGEGVKWEIRLGPPATFRFLIGELSRPVERTFRVDLYPPSLDYHGRSVAAGEVAFNGTGDFVDYHFWTSGPVQVRTRMRSVGQSFKGLGRWGDRYEQLGSPVYDPAPGEMIEIPHPTAEIGLTLLPGEAPSRNVPLVFEEISTGLRAEASVSPYQDAEEVFLSNLIPGSYRLSTNLTYPHHYPDQYFPSLQTSREDSPILFLGAQDSKTISWTLDPGGIVSGAVLAFDGLPISDKWVFATTTSSPEVVSRYVRTDSEGEYALFGLVDGDYRVGVSPDDTTQVFYPDGSTWKDGQAVQILEFARQDGITIVLPE